MTERATQPPGQGVGESPSPVGSEPAPAVLPGPAPAALDYTERLLGHPLALRRGEVSAAADVSAEQARLFWHALGFPMVDTDEKVFGEADVEALQTVVDVVAEGLLDEETALSLTRAFARSTDRLAGWQSQLVAEAVQLEALQLEEVEVDGAEPGLTTTVPSREAAIATADRLVRLMPRLEPLLVYAWRRHLSDTVGRLLADSDPSAYGLAATRSVGFADLVGFSALVRRMSERDLARLVSRFEALSADVITAHGGRLVKTVGDAVLFTTVSAAPAAAVALDLVEALGADDVLPAVRVGMARGPVLLRLGDVFGTTVNSASRLAAVAPVDAVLVDAALARELATLSGFVLTGQRRRVLRGVGTVTPSLLQRASASGRR